MSIAVYPGSFDPITLGHLDVIRRAAEVFPRVAVVVLVNTRKVPGASVEERLGVIEESVRGIGLAVPERVMVTAHEGLTVDVARALGARHLVRGLRGGSDLDAEVQMARLNRRLAPEVDTLFFPAAAEHADLSSSLVREIAALGGDISMMVPAPAARLLGRRGGAGR